jgi:ketosteroid isomerase-like protein
MRKLTPETAVIAVELQQILAEFTHDLDFNSCRGIADFYAEDGVFAVGDYTHKGRAAIRKFYDERNERVRAQHKDGIRVSAHTFVNVRITVEDKNNATAYFTNVNYAGEGKPPVRMTITPALVTDCRMTFRREADGNWYITSFTGSALFVGDDPFSKGTLLKS